MPRRPRRCRVCHGMRDKRDTERAGSGSTPMGQIDHVTRHHGTRARVLRGRLDGPPGGPRAVGVAAPARAAAGRGEARRARARPRLRRRPLHRRAARRGRRRRRRGHRGRGADPRPAQRPRRGLPALRRGDPAPPRRGRPRVVLRGARARPGHDLAADRDPPRPAARGPRAAHRARPRPAQAHADRTGALRRPLRPAGRAPALLHPPLAHPRAARHRLRGRRRCDRSAAPPLLRQAIVARAIRG